MATAESNEQGKHDGETISRSRIRRYYYDVYLEDNMYSWKVLRGVAGAVGNFVVLWNEINGDRHHLMKTFKEISASFIGASIIIATMLMVCEFLFY